MRDNISRMAIFKMNWERNDITSSLSESTIHKMVQMTFPEKALSSYEIISKGCANFNIKIQLRDDSSSYILRIYLRDKDAAYRERNLGALLKDKIPTPLSYFTGEIDGYTFAITKFMPGNHLENLLQSEATLNLSKLMYKVGIMLSRIRIFNFSEPGFFDKDLNIISRSTSNEILLTHIAGCLSNQNVITVLGSETIQRLTNYFDQSKHLFPAESEHFLVHGDFDPANILINEINNEWEISGILDWEFAFSGSYLWDVANMLRYAHKMPPEFQNAFIQGLNDGGIQLPPNWRSTVDLLNASALLDCLKRSDAQKKPNQCSDIEELIIGILENP